MNPKTKMLLTLERDAERLNTANHESFMQDALECLVRGGSAQDAVTLVQKLEHTAFTARPGLKQAHSEVLDWLQKTVNQSPIPTEAELIWRIGWLRRMARASRSLDGRDGRRRNDSEQRVVGSGAHADGEQRRNGERQNRERQHTARSEMPASQGFGTLATKLGGLKLAPSSPAKKG